MKAFIATAILLSVVVIICEAKPPGEERPPGRGPPIGGPPAGGPPAGERRPPPPRDFTMDPSVTGDHRLHGGEEEEPGKREDHTERPIDKKDGGSKRGRREGPKDHHPEEPKDHTGQPLHNDHDGKPEDHTDGPRQNDKKDGGTKNGPPKGGPKGGELKP